MIQHDESKLGKLRTDTQVPVQFQIIGPLPWPQKEQEQSESEFVLLGKSFITKRISDCLIKSWSVSKWP